METDKEREARMGRLSDRDLIRKIAIGSNRDKDAAEKELKRRKGDRRARKDVEDFMIGSGAAPKSILRRLTGW